MGAVRAAVRLITDRRTLYSLLMPLRNVARTAPHVHDGAAADLAAAAGMMAKVQLRRTLPAEAVAEIVLFPEALSGPLPSNYRPPDAE
jgi:cytochrome c peroxidase